MWITSHAENRVGKQETWVGADDAEKHFKCYSTPTMPTRAAGSNIAETIMRTRFVCMKQTSGQWGQKSMIQIIRETLQLRAPANHLSVCLCLSASRRPDSFHHTPSMHSMPSLLAVATKTMSKQNRTKSTIAHAHDLAAAVGEGAT